MYYPFNNKIELIRAYSGIILLSVICCYKLYTGNAIL